MEGDASHTSHKKSSSSIFLIVGIIFIIIAIAIALIFFPRGKSTTTGSYPEPESSESITCEATGLTYPAIDPRDASHTITKITATFKKDTLDSISLAYSLYYDTADRINASLNTNHANLNLATQKEGLGSDIFNLHFNKLSDRLEFHLYAEAKDISATSAKYLLLNTYPDTGTYTKSLIESTYQAAGLKCATK